MPAPVRNSDPTAARGNIYDALGAEGESAVIDNVSQELERLEVAGFDTVVVVDGAPVVDDNKADKLLAVIQKIFKQCGELKSDGVWMPKNSSSNKYQGLLFVDFVSSKGAVSACKKLDNYRLDKNHTLKVAKFDDVEKAMSLESQFTAPEMPEYAARDHIKSWLLDPSSRDQLMTQVKDDYSIAFNNKNEALDVVFTAQNWSDYYALWSPQGSYVCTIHRQGAALWGGPKFGQLKKFHHNNVKLIDFSPCERFLVTWSRQPVVIGGNEEANTMVWNVLSGELLCSLLIDERDAPESLIPVAHEYAMSNMSYKKCREQLNSKWPLLNWSSDGSYVAYAKCGPEGSIQIYESETMTLLDKTGVNIANLMDFSWSPTQPIVVYWCPEIDNAPARVTFMEIPSRRILRTKNVFNLASLQMVWQSNGDYLALLLELFNKSRKQKFFSLEICRMREKNIPVEVVELPQTETVTELKWEHGGGHLFSLLSKEGPKIFVSFYSAKPNAAGANSTRKMTRSNSNQSLPAASAAPVEIQQLAKLDKKGINTVVWSPNGRFCVLAAVLGFEGTLEFFDSEDLVVLKSTAHYLCTNIEWDPSGRYLLTSVSRHKYDTDTGYQMWSVTGDHIAKEMLSGLFCVMWRPRSPSLLPAQTLKQIKKRLKEYSKEFEEADLALLNRSSVEVQEARRAQWAEWQQMYEKWHKKYLDTMVERIQLLGYDPMVDPLHEPSGKSKQYEEWEEIVLEETEEVVSDY